jgi:Mg/Co/Ni transporter MgtE (contains CBS domain)
MNLASTIPDFDTPVLQHARKDFPLLDADMSVGEALERIRREGVGERVIYFYAIDEEKRLVGVVPTRRLLTAPLETALREVMVRRVVAVPAKATVLDACEFFVLYKFLAFPVVDEQRRVVGIIDANLFAEEILEAGDTQDRSRSARLCRSVRSFLRRSVFASNKSVVHRRGALFDSASHGCSSR